MQKDYKNHTITIEDINRAHDALGALILMAESAKAYAKGYTYAYFALIWARTERDRLALLIKQWEG
ncbi:MAG TPA: hypothetical protein VKS24_24870 [Bradyrhizobium sp.]|nr:hypothetical protein [Bradyrhizobium sp.]